MADLSDFIPLLQVTLAELRARADAQVNAGVSPDDTGFVDTAVGGFFYDVSQATLIELERAYDLLGTELPAAATILFAFGDYLDDKGDELGIPRLEATAAQTEVRFSGDDGVAIPTGTEVAILLTDPDATEDDEVIFRTTEGGVTSGGFVDLAAVAEDPGEKGNVAAGTLTVILSNIDLGDTGTITNAAAAFGGRDVETDELYRARLLLGVAPGAGGGTIPDFQRWALEEPGVGFAYVRPFTPTAGRVEVLLTDTDNVPVPVAVRRSYHDRIDPPAATTKLSGSQSLAGATINVDSTNGFRPTGRFLVDDPLLVNSPYWITYTGVTSTSFTGCTGGPALTGADDAPVTQRGSARGLVRENAETNVRTLEQVAVNVAGTVAFQPGYSLDGATGTTATRDQIEASLRAYLNRLGPDDDVSLNAVRAQFFRVKGVRDVTGLTLNGSAADVTIQVLQIARTGTLTGIA